MGAGAVTWDLVLDGDAPHTPGDVLAHEAAHAMTRIRDGHLESDVIPLATTISTMEVLDEIRAQIGVVYPEERPA
jgi:hypothetical protein